MSDDPFSIRYVPDQYNTPEICDKALDDCLSALKFVPGWFLTSKIIKTLFPALDTGENVLCFNEDYGNAAFTSNGISILNIDINNINLVNNFYEEDPDTFILIRFLAWHIKFDKLKNLNQNASEELMPIV